MVELDLSGVLVRLATECGAGLLDRPGPLVAFTAGHPGVLASGT
jgi:hypothetical protein